MDRPSADQQQAFQTHARFPGFLMSPKKTDLGLQGDGFAALCCVV
jgi:hypothetical protein